MKVQFEKLVSLKDSEFKAKITNTFKEVRDERIKILGDRTIKRN